MAYQKSTNQLCLFVLLFRLLIRPRIIYQNFCLVFYQVWWKIIIVFVILGNLWSMLKTVMLKKMKFLYLLTLLVCLLLCQWTRPLTSCWNFSHLMMLCLLAHLSASPISNKVQKSAWFYYLFLQRLFSQANLWYSHGFLHLPYHC